MANLHHLFYSTDAEKQTLHRRIVPNQLQQEQQQERWNGLRDFLVKDLSEKTGHPISSWLQGSYKFGTQVRPASKWGEFDIDLGIYFHWEGTPEDGNHTSKELKDVVQASLVQYQSETDDVADLMDPPKERCARIHFSGGFHVDVPVYHLNKERDARALATESNGWEFSDPKAFYLWFRELFSDEESTQIRRVIRYIKIWAALKLEKNPSSVLLTVLISEAYLQLTGSETERDDIAIKNIIENIIERLEIDTSVPNPVDEEEDINRLTDEENNTFLNSLKKLLDVAERALEEDSSFTASTIWAEAFEHFFPPPVPNTHEENSRALIPVQFVPRVHVRAVPDTNPNRSYQGENRIGPIPRNCNISFNLQNSNELPEGARVQWIVRNEGDEAEYTNDLGHFADEGTTSSEEKSAYRGTHYMDVVVASPLMGVIGFERVLVEISGVFMPARNPKKKPGYTRLRRRR